MSIHSYYIYIKQAIHTYVIVDIHIAVMLVVSYYVIQNCDRAIENRPSGHKLHYVFWILYSAFAFCKS